MKRTSTLNQPGSWPVARPVDLGDDEQGRQHLELTATQARFHVTLGAIRGDLEAQPSAVSVRTAVRRWCEAIVAAGDDITKQLSA